MAKKTTSIGWSDPRTLHGELLWPSRFGPEEVASLRRILGPYGFAGQMQQTPAPPEGGIFKKNWIKYARFKDDRLHLPDGRYVFRKQCFVFCTVDPAVTEKDTTKKSDPDFTAMAAWLAFPDRHGVGLVLLDLLRDRFEGPDILTEMERFHRRWDFTLIGVESIAFQMMLFQAARRRGLPVREMSQKEDAIYRIDRDKVARAMGATPLVSDGRLYVPEDAPWLSIYLHELTTFPRADHDDTVDCTTAAVGIAEKYYRGGGFEVDEGEPRKRLRPREKDEDEIDDESDRPRTPAERAFPTLPNPDTL